MKFIAALRTFTFFENYMNQIKLETWISLGLTAKICIFQELKPICRLGDIALDVYFNLKGTIKVLMENKNKYTHTILDTLSKGNIKAGIGFGELGVLYGNKR